MVGEGGGEGGGGKEGGEGAGGLGGGGAQNTHRDTKQPGARHN